MSKRILSLLVIAALLATLLSGCGSKEEDFGVADTMGNESNQEQDEENSSSPDSDQKEENKPDTDQKDEKPSTDDQKDPAKPNTPDEGNGGTNNTTKPDPSDKEQGGTNETPAQSTIKTLTNLQKAGAAFNVKAGQTVWFGPMPMNQETALTAGGKAVGVSALKEIAKLGGGYRLYSYKATADGAVTVSAPKGYESKFLISLDQEMTEKEYYYHIDQNGVQLYDSALDSTGKTIAPNGKETTSSDWHLTHGVSLKQGDTLTFGPCFSAQAVQGFGYDAKGKATSLINASNLKEEETLGGGYKIYTYTVPAEVTSVRLLVAADLKGKFAMVKNKAFNGSEYTNLTGVSGSSLPDVLKGKEVLFVGDSICEGFKNSNTGIARFPDAYAGLIAKKTGTISTNAGVGSSTISNQKPVYKQFEALQKNDYDLVVIQGGINDMSHKRKVGEMSDSFEPEEWDLTTYAGGLEYTIYKAIEYYGDTASVGYLFTPAFPNHPSGNYGTLPQFLAVAKEICEKWGVPFLNLCENAELNQKLQINEKVNTGDFIHLNANGYEIVTPYIIDFMRTMTPYEKKF